MPYFLYLYIYIQLLFNFGAIFGLIFKKSFFAFSRILNTEQAWKSGKHLKNKKTKSVQTFLTLKKTKNIKKKFSSSTPCSYSLQKSDNINFLLNHFKGIKRTLIIKMYSETSSPQYALWSSNNIVTFFSSLQPLSPLYVV